MRIERLVLGTSNPGKIKEWKRLLDGVVDLVEAEKLNIKSPKEEGKNFKEIAKNKAGFYAKKTNEFVLSEDGGFEIDALGGLPGIKSRRILPGEKEGSDEDLINYVMQKLKGLPKEKRGARLVVHVVISDPKGEIIFEDKGSIEGVVPKKPAQSFTPGYPYRAILFVPEAGKNYSEFSKEEHEKLNHRVPIAEQLEGFLLEYQER